MIINKFLTAACTVGLGDVPLIVKTVSGLTENIS